MADELNTGKEELQEGGIDEVEEEYISWKKNAPLLYDTLVTHLLEWPALTCQYFLKSEESKTKGTLKQYFAVGNTTSDEGEPYLSLMSSTIPTFTGEANGLGKTLETGSKSSFKCVKTERKIPHPGDINKLRICPNNQRIVATKSDNGKVFLWDIEAAENTPILTMGEHAVSGFALDWNCVGTSKLISADNKGSIHMYYFEQDFEVRAEHTEPTAENVSKEHQVTAKRMTKEPDLKFDNKGAAVNEVKFQRMHGSIFGAVSDDCTITLWDVRSKTNPFFRILGHTSEIFCLDFAHNDEYLLLTGGSDNLVKLWDIRKVVRPVHEFDAHTDKVLRVEWSPANETVFASCGEDRTVNLWDCSCIGNDVSNEDNMDGPPELLFSHKGHRGIVEDLSWNPLKDFGLLSVDGENMLQIWEIDDKLYYVD